MRRLFVLILLATFLVSVAGCAPKSEYDKLLEQKAGLEKQVEAISAESSDLKAKITAREMEIRDLKNALKVEKAKTQRLERELVSLRGELTALKSKTQE